MRLKVKTNWDKLGKRLDELRTKVPQHGANLVAKSATQMDANVREHLGGQGRGGEPPPLTSATRRIYGIRGEPTGTGITNHLTLEFKRRGNVMTAVLGIPEGRPTMIAKVQDRGQLILVSEKMRGFLAAVYGIYLRQDTTHILIPARYFWYRSLQKTKKQTIERLKRFHQEALK